MLKRVSFLVACVMLTGCVHTIGKDFKEPGEAQLRLGTTTRQDILALMGEPTKQSQNSVSEKSPEDVAKLTPFDAAPTNRMSAFIDYSFWRMTNHREMAFIFSDDRLTSYLFLSNFPEDGSNFDDAKISLIKKGVTTEPEIIRYFGSSYGKSIYPTVRDSGTHELRFNYPSEKNAREGKELRVLFDSKNVVKDFKFSSNINLGS